MMFDNAGSKLKTIAKVEFWIGIIVSVILGIMVISGGIVIGGGRNSYGSEVSGGTLFFSGLLIILGGAFSSWFSSLGIYALGELVENSKHTRDSAQEAASELRSVVTLMRSNDWQTKSIQKPDDQISENSAKIMKQETDKEMKEEKNTADESTVQFENGEAVRILQTALGLTRGRGFYNYLRDEIPKQQDKTKELLMPLLDLPDEEMMSAAEKVLAELHNCQ